MSCPREERERLEHLMIGLFAAANPAVKADSHFEGLGVLLVKGGGTTIIFR